MKVLNVAIWGLGRHAINKIIPELLLMKNINLIGICSRNKKNIKKFENEIGCIGWTDPDQMLNHKSVDVVLITSPIGLHYDHAKAALSSGKHVWCEKPLTSKHSDTLELIRLAKNKQLILKECFMSLHHPQFQFVKKFVKDNLKSGVKSLMCRFGMPFLENIGFRSDPNLCGGAVWDLGSHTIATSIELFPNEEVKLLFSEMTFDKSNVDFDGRAIIKFSGGTSAYLEWGFGVSYKNDINIWANKSSLYTDKIFSKPKNFQPKFDISNEKGVIRSSYGEVSNQFQNMYLDFYKSHQLSYKKSIDVNMIKRSKIIDEIIKFAEKKYT